MKKLACTLFSCLLLAASCKKSDSVRPSQPGDTALQLSRTALQLSGTANAADTVAVKAPGDWKLSVDVAGQWLQFSVKEGKKGTTVLTVTATSANSSSARTATVTVSPADGGGTPVTLTVTQQVAAGKPWPLLGSTGNELQGKMIRTLDGGFLAIGQTGGMSGVDLGGDVGIAFGNDDGWVVKLDAAGNKQWAKTIGTSQPEDFQSGLATPDGGYLLVGNAGMEPNTDAWVVKIDGNGNQVWSKNFGGTGDDVALGIAPSPDGGYVVAGYSSSQNSGDVGNVHGRADMWLLKLDASGNKIWSNIYGGSNDDDAIAIVAAPGGGYAVLGTTFSNSSGDVGVTYGQADLLLMKVDESGKLTWLKTYGGDNYDLPTSLTTTSDGGYALTGYTSSTLSHDIGENAGGDDCLVMKLDGAGNLIWSKLYGGLNEERGYQINELPDHHLFVTGYTTSSNSGVVGANHSSSGDIWLLNIDPSGNLQSQKLYGGSSEEQEAFGVCGSDGSCFVGCSSKSTDGDLQGLTNHGGYDLWIFKVQ